MLLGPVPKNFSFLPKHKANAYKWSCADPSHGFYLFIFI